MPKQNQDEAPSDQDTTDEKVDIPVPIAGVLLYCLKDKVEGASATVLCAVHDRTTNKPIKLADKYVARKFNFVAPPALQVSFRELPANAYWHAEYTVKASSAEIVTAGLGSVVFRFEGTDINSVVEKLETLGADAVRPDLTIQSLKPQANAEFRCFDYFRLLGDKVVTTPCGARNSSQDWFVTPDGKIAHVSGVCIKFNPVSRLTIEGDCNLSDTPRFDIQGEQIKIRNTDTCVGLINPDLSGVDYVGSVPCNTADVTQHWKVSPRILP